METKNDKRIKVIYILFVTVLILGAVMLLSLIAGNAVKKAGSALKPVLYGMIIAYLFKPMCNFFYRRFYRLFSRKFSHAASRKAAHVLSMVVTYIIWGGIIYFILTMLIMQVAKSLASLVASTPRFVATLTAWVTELMENNPILADNAEMIINSVTTAFTGWYDNYFFPTVLNITDGLMTSFTFIFNLFVGLVVSIYLLHTRKKLAAQSKLMVKGFFGKRRAEKIFEEIRFADDMFSGFFVGKLIDSAIVAAVCYIACRIMNIPYPELVSVIVGIANMIPFFGPYIGMIPSAIVILTVSPFAALTFLIMDWFLQQIDGNILGPKIIGNNTGLSSFWVLFSILLFGGVFGFFGMLIGVPVFAVIYDIFGKFIRSYLQRRGEGGSLSDYDKEFPVKERNQSRRKRTASSQNARGGFFSEEDENVKDEQLSFDTEQDSGTASETMDDIPGDPDNVDYTEQEDYEQIKFL